MGGAKTEIKKGSNDFRGVRGSVLQMIPAGIVAEIFAVAVDGEIAQPNFPAAGSRFHDVEKSKAIESCTVGFVTVGQMTDGIGIVNSGGDAAAAVVAVRIVMKGPAVHGAFGAESL